MKSLFQVSSKLLFLSGLLFLFMITSSCEGKQGPQGLPGIDGQDGTNGQDGNANIKSTTFSIASDSWNENGISGSAGYFISLNLTVSSITADVKNNGLVMAYFKESGETNWKVLPFTTPRSSFTEVFEFSVLTGKVQLKVSATDDLASKYTGEVRVVTATSEGLYAPINYSDFQEVKDYFNLSEIDEDYHYVTSSIKSKNQ